MPCRSRCAGERPIGPPVRIIGAGPTGALLAILLQRRGHAVELYESRPDPRETPVRIRPIHQSGPGRSRHSRPANGGRVPGSRGSAAADARTAHSSISREAPRLQPYGQRPNEVIYSISRHRLNQSPARRRRSAARGRACTSSIDSRLPNSTRARRCIRDLRRDRLDQRPHAAAAGDRRRRLIDAPAHELAALIEAHETDLEHGYKELSIPADAAGRHRMARDALHIWPRGNYMLIALPNEDGSFTATLFLAKHGDGQLRELDRARRHRAIPVAQVFRTRAH